MDAKDFAKQYFDFWQQSMDQVMRDPQFADRMLELMQQTQQVWKHSQVIASHEPAAAKYPNPPSPFTRPTANDGDDPITIAELASRLELCEQRLAVVEALIRQQPPQYSFRDTDGISE